MDNIIIIAAVVAIFLAIFVNLIIKKIFPVQIGTISAFSKRAVTIWVICFILCLYGLTALFGPKKEETSTEDTSYTEEDYWQEDSGTDEDVIMEDSVDDINDDVDIDQMKQEALELVAEYGYDTEGELGDFMEFADGHHFFRMDFANDKFEIYNSATGDSINGVILEPLSEGVFLCKRNKGNYFLSVIYNTSREDDEGEVYNYLEMDSLEYYENEWCYNRSYTYFEY